MKMTRKKPTQEGYYWYLEPCYPARIVHVVKYNNYFRDSVGKLFFHNNDEEESHALVSKAKGLWSARLPEPEYV